MVTDQCNEEDEGVMMKLNGFETEMFFKEKFECRLGGDCKIQWLGNGEIGRML